MTDTIPPDTQRTGIHDTPAAPPDSHIGTEASESLLGSMPSDIATTRHIVADMRDMLREHMASDTVYRAEQRRWLSVALVGAAVAVMVAVASLAVSVAHMTMVGAGVSCSGEQTGLANR